MEIQTGSSWPGPRTTALSPRYMYVQECGMTVSVVSPGHYQICGMTGSIVSPGHYQICGMTGSVVSLGHYQICTS